MMKTFLAKSPGTKRKWVLIDATDQTMGRLASRIALILMGKHRPTYTPYVDTGDAVIVVNSSKMKLTGRKAEKKTYFCHTQGWLGHWRLIPYSEMEAKHPGMPLGLAVRRMLPKGSLGKAMFKKLKIFPGPDHPHEAQCPETLEN